MTLPIVVYTSETARLIMALKRNETSSFVEAQSNMNNCYKPCGWGGGGGRLGASLCTVHYVSITESGQVPIKSRGSLLLDPCLKLLRLERKRMLSLDTALPPREDYVQVVCVLKPRYKKCTEKEKIKMIGLKRMYKKN